MIKDQLLKDLKKVIEDLGYPSSDALLSIPPKPGFGDYSTNTALQLAKLDRGGGEQSPMVIANEIAENLSYLSYLSDLKVEKPGFLNFFIKPEVISQQVGEILKAGEKFGGNSLGQGQKIEVEFISANPTGPLTLGNGRGGTLGDTLANVLKKSGYDVHREYYVNDTGNQIRLLGESVLAASGKLDKKEEHYQGEYVKELTEKFADQLDNDPQTMGHKLADYLLDKEIKPAIERLGVYFDEFYSERSVYERDLIAKTVDLLLEKGLAYESEGALWFKATEFGDEKDRVLKTSEKTRGREEPTYFLADIAHHLDVLQRGYVKRINILGADHHGYGARMKGVMEALGYKDKIEMIFMQFVRLFKEGQEVRMSKRAGNFVTLDELLDLTNKDIARFFFLMYSPNSLIDFNLDLAKEKSEKNPVFYVQYAHARMVNILVKSKVPPEARLAKGGKSQKSKFEKANFEILETKEELNLIKHLAQFPTLIEETAKNYQVQALTQYALDLADLFHKFYEGHRVLNAETEELKEGRLALVEAARIVLANNLKLMGIEAPERM